jgi:hypothetical protein
MIDEINVSNINVLQVLTAAAFRNNVHKSIYLMSNFPAECEHECT